MDVIVSEESTDNLFDVSDKVGAPVTLTWQNIGHGLTKKDIIDTRNWLGGKKISIDLESFCSCC
ncbi:MAG: hypothetical protein M3162_05645 [Thermoproteota archaeon]|nr:hypothetical protein [Thermoproteota archaeon]